MSKEKELGFLSCQEDPGTEHYADIIEMLEARIDAPKLGEIPYKIGRASCRERVLDGV